MAVDEDVPKLVWVVRNREPARASAIALDGTLLTPSNIAYTASLSIWVSAALIDRAVRVHGDTAETRAALVDEAIAAGVSLPLAPDSDTIKRWLTQLRGGEVSFRFNRASELTLAHLSALVALAASGARHAGLGREGIYAQYAAVSEKFTHGRRLPEAWT